MFLDARDFPGDGGDMRRSRSEGNLFNFVEGLETTSVCSGGNVIISESGFLFISPVVIFTIVF